MLTLAGRYTSVGSGAAGRVVTECNGKEQTEWLIATAHQNQTWSVSSGNAAAGHLPLAAAAPAAARKGCSSKL